MAFRRRTFTTAFGSPSGFRAGSRFAPSTGTIPQNRESRYIGVPEAFSGQIVSPEKFSIVTTVFLPTVATTGGQSAATGLASEADTSSSLGRVKLKSVGLATEAGASFALARSKAKALGLSTEADTSSALARLKAKATGVSSETDDSQSLSRAKAKVLSLSTESDSAFALSRGGQTVQVGLATESDEAFAIARLVEAQDAGGFVRVSKSARKKTKEWLARQRTIILPVGLATERSLSFALDAEFPRPKWVSFTPNLDAVKPPRRFQPKAKQPEVKIDYAAIAREREKARIKARRKRDEELLLFIA